MNNRHFSEFTYYEKSILLKHIKDEIEKQTGIPKYKIKDVLVTGSRVYELNGKKDFYKHNSDLDTIGVIEENEFFKRFNITNPDVKDKENSSWLESFNFFGIRVSVFLLPENHLHYAKYRYWLLPLVSLKDRKVYNFNESHLLDYLQNVKCRIKPMTFCGLCLQEKESLVTLDLSIRTIPIPEILKDDLLPKYRIYVCKDCLAKYLKNGLKSFLEKCTEQNND